MKMNLMKKLLVTVIALGLSLNGICFKFLAPETVMASSTELVDSMMMTETEDDCGKMNMVPNANCLLVSNNYAIDKTFKIKVPDLVRKNCHHLGEIIAPTEVFNNNRGKNNRLLYQRLREQSSLTGLTGQIVKRE